MGNKSMGASEMKRMFDSEIVPKVRMKRRVGDG
jgi:hypothetical protein